MGTGGTHIDRASNAESGTLPRGGTHTGTGGTHIDRASNAESGTLS